MGNPRSKSFGTQTGLDLQPHQIIMRPLVTEKDMYQSNELNQYAFEVNPRAGKDQIRHAVEMLFNVRVTRVRTQNRGGKPRRFRYREGYTKNWKKAVVTLHGEDRINFF